MPADIHGALHFFERAFDYVKTAGLYHEVEWQRQTSLSSFTETDLLREAAWVILCSGFREATVRRLFDYISLCFCDWESAKAITEASGACVVAARSCFRNEKKLMAIVRVAEQIEEAGFETMKQAVLSDPIGELRRLPYIGPITTWHLAKNLGFDAGKPDRHLLRISEKLGFDGVNSFCQTISVASGEQAKVVDLIVWRYMADNPALFRKSLVDAINV
ncbi:hypothetical protein ACMX25_01710 [Caballeronia sp. 15715]|uniref:hypothetical protein n=1 Tax=Caballeronia sp. 15715 TaxID=3391030 RepID=UPI0039E6F40F